MPSSMFFTVSPPSPPPPRYPRLHRQSWYRYDAPCLRPPYNDVETRIACYIGRERHSSVCRVVAVSEWRAHCSAKRSSVYEYITAPRLRPLPAFVVVVEA